MARWEKLGRIFEAAGQIPWLQSHAAVPIAEPIGDSWVRVYFSARDGHQRSHTGALVFDLNDPERTVALEITPILVPGELGAFDDSGAMGTWLTQVGETRYLYYIGWNLGITVPFRNAIGLAISHGGQPFEKRYPGPIVDRTAQEPHFCASCAVVVSEGRWRMWYLSCTGWSECSEGLRHHYHIKSAESSDGIHWQREGRVAIPFKNASEYAISRPSVLHDEQGWHMWYSHRGERYRLGYAHSEDGLDWTRRDEAVGIDVSASGWDSEMICYPHVFDLAGERYMLYNGNGFGRSGLGLARLVR